MDVEILCKVVLILVFTSFSIIRIQYQRLAQKARLRTVIRESKKYSVLLSVLICYEVATLFLWLLYPESLAFAAIMMHPWLRFVGVALGIVALLLFVWVHQNLGRFFTIYLRIAEEHSLVKTGPYRWVRHPMYTAFYLLHIASFLLAANWFIGITWTAGLTVIILLRIKREEAMLLEAFGERYRSYLDKTGRFFPRVSLGAPAARKK